ncbi:MAG: GAF domain-containing protein [Alphaproteobacteria bacterium]
MFLPDVKNRSRKAPSEYCALNREIINSPNIFQTTGIDTDLIAKFDDANNYSTISLLAIPLVDRKDNLLGVAQFTNAKDANGKIISFTTEAQKVVLSVCKLITIALENKNQKKPIHNSWNLSLKCLRVPSMPSHLIPAAIASGFPLLPGSLLPLPFRKPPVTSKPLK